MQTRTLKWQAQNPKSEIPAIYNPSVAVALAKETNYSEFYD